MWLWLLTLYLPWVMGQGEGSPGLTQEELMSWVKLKVLEGLGVEEPPALRAPNEERRNLGSRMSRRRAERGQRSGVGQEEMQVILFTSSEPSCVSSVPGHSSGDHLTFLFQPSVHHRVSSAQFWFFPGVRLQMNSSVSVLTAGQQPLPASPSPSHLSQDGWSTYDMSRDALQSLGEGPFHLRVHCPQCKCVSDPDKRPFLNMKVKNDTPKSATRGRRSVSLPWSPSVVDLLQRPSQENPGDCDRASVQISFEELGWDSWIVHPKTLTFYYCHGNCSSPERTASRLGVTQCCAPVPGSMTSIRITTTSDGGYSFKYETLPNIMPQECACM